MWPAPLPRCAYAIALVLASCRSVPATDEIELRSLLASLSHDDSLVRDGAQARLEELSRADDSEAVERILCEGEKASDPEVAARCKAVLSSIRYWKRLFVVWSGRANGAFDVEAGRFAWTREEEDCDTRALWMSSEGKKPGIFEVDQERGLSRLDPRTGKRLWTVGEVCGRGVDVGDRWIGETSRGATCISVEDGRRLWIAQVPWSEDAVLIDGGKAIASRSCSDVTALDVETGQTLWDRHVGRLEWLGEIRGGLFGVIWPNGDRRPRPFEVVRLDPRSGRELWRRDMAPEICFPVLYDGGAANDLVILSTQELGMREGQRTVAMDATSGDVRWSLTSKMQDILLEANGGHAFIVTDEHIARIDLSSGKIVERQPLTYHWARAFRDGDQVLVLCAEALGGGAEARCYEPGSLRVLWRTRLSDHEEIHCLVNSSMICEGRVERKMDRLVVFRQSSSGDHMDFLGGARGELLRRVDLNGR